MIIGIDEVGRGALAGPLVVCALVIVKQSAFPIDAVRDSKDMAAIERRGVLSALEESCQWRYGIVSNVMIDRLGIQGANVLAVDLAIRDFPRDARYLADAIGGFKHYTTHRRTISFYVRGESRYPEIAAASIVAKVYRDALMREYAAEYPEYGFGRHVGYGTVEHRLAIRQYGLTPLHRKSFIIHSV